MSDIEKPERSLEALLRAVAEDDARLKSSPAVEMRLHGELRAIARAGRVKGLAIGLAAAAVVAIAVSVPFLQHQAPPAANQAPAAPIAAADADAVVTEFFPLMYSMVPIGDGQIVRMEVPRTALASFALGSGESSGSSLETVLADVLVGEDGLARAVRFVGARALGVVRETQ